MRSGRSGTVPWNDRLRGLPNAPFTVVDSSFRWGGALRAVVPYSFSSTARPQRTLRGFWTDTVR